MRTRRSKARSHQRRVHSPSFCPTVSSSSTPSDAAAASSNGLNSSGNGTTKTMVRNRDGEGERSKMEEEEQKLLLFKFQRSMEKVQHSAFFTKFMEQLQDLELFEILLGTSEQGGVVDEAGSCWNGAASSSSSSSTGASPAAATNVSDGNFLPHVWLLSTGVAWHAETFTVSGVLSCGLLLCRLKQDAFGQVPAAQIRQCTTERQRELTW